MKVSVHRSNQSHGGEGPVETRTKQGTRIEIELRIDEALAAIERGSFTQEQIDTAFAAFAQHHLNGRQRVYV